MGVLSNQDIEKNISDREEIKNTKTIPKYNKEFEQFRKKYKSPSSRRPIEPKGWDKIEDNKELEHEI